MLRLLQKTVRLTSSATRAKTNFKNQNGKSNLEEANGPSEVSKRHEKNEMQVASGQASSGPARAGLMSTEDYRRVLSLLKLLCCD